MSGAYLTNQLLVAMPSLADPYFAQSVALICEHTDKGALGIVLNRPLDMTIGEVFDQLQFECRDEALRETPVLRGGPVQQDRGFVLHTPGTPYSSSLTVTSEVAFTTSIDVLEAVAVSSHLLRSRALSSRVSMPFRKAG